MPTAIIFDLQDTLTDESSNDRSAIGALRQIVAQAGVRVPEVALQQAEDFAVRSFAPDLHEAMIFSLVGRRPEIALRCISTLRKTHQRSIKLRDGAVETLRACRELGWRIALAKTPDEAEAVTLSKAGVLELIDVKGPPPTARVTLPDARVLEHLAAKVGVKEPSECVVMGNRIDRVIRPGNLLHMLTVQVHVGFHANRQLPRDLKDVPTYEAEDLHQVLNVLPGIE